MKNNLKSIAWTLGALAVLTTGCRQKAAVEVEIKGLQDGPVYVHYAPVTDLSAVVDDTLQAEDGKFSFSPAIGEVPLEIRIEPAADLRVDRRGRLSVPMSQIGRAHV